MEIFFKKYFWTLTLGFLTVAGFLAAKTVNTFIDAELQTLPTAGAEVAGSSPQPVVRRGSKDVTAITTRNIFNSEAKPEAPKTAVEPVAAVTEPDDPGSGGEETDLDVELVAVILTDHPSWSFAEIRERRSEDAGLFKIGDTIRNEAKIIGIEWRRVVILRNGKHELLTMFAERPKPKSPAFSPRPPTPGGAPSVAVDDRNIKKVGQNDYVIAREEVDKQLSNLNYLATQARIVPHFEGGQGAGFKLFAIRPGSLYSKIGIQNGDVIKRINGEMINSPDKALEAYARLKGANQITIDVERNGVKRTLSYTIGN